MVLQPPEQAPAGCVGSVPDLPGPQEPKLSLIPADVSQQSLNHITDDVTYNDYVYFIVRLQVFSHHFDKMTLKQQELVLKDFIMPFLIHSGDYCKIYKHFLSVKRL